MTNPAYVVSARLSLRFLQFAASLVVVVTLSYAFSSASDHTGGGARHPAVGDNDLTFAMLMSFLGLVYGLFYLVFVEVLMMCMRPLLYCEQAMDAVMALLLLIASIVLTASDAFLRCRAHSAKPRCDAITAGVAFCYVSAATFAASLLLSCCTERDPDNYDQAVFGEDSPLSYEYDPTPVAAETPTFESPLVKV
ncbi:hypothetical protein PybrP1_007046 [[Pythium] brassicae (nom. inval.)]|nr:hypothetical protein PybrP1_007046 [[Pythium] brassicae (nom. inval.)]